MAFTPVDEVVAGAVVELAMIHRVERDEKSSPGPSAVDILLEWCGS
jgi:hypothetical protein